MSTANEEQWLELVRLVRESAKYAPIDEALVAAIGRTELGKRHSLKEAVKSTRNKLHQVGSAFQEKPIPYGKWLEELKDLPADMGSPQVRKFLIGNMRLHASTSERLSIHEEFFAKTLASIAPVTSILDLACGLNPLNLPWMPVAEHFTYEACDIYADMVGYVNAFFKHFNIEGSAGICDLTRSIPQTHVQVALLLKTIPCLEQLDKTAGRRLLEGLNADHILVSFPAHSLGGRSKGMVENYEAHFSELIAGMDWQVIKFEFPGELAFLVRKHE
jgi:16S rRNA (guanine(1405)-N(7))-methyltransferase